ncbi:MAG: GNAT family N-acetyltransferase [Chlorobi bacterium]|nr:GNAT family N-acetyltransferase [Chlorobiota bacterium]MCI0716832.1 GNAT family N-acetyltransferase [Chlorobiota bacterium]
MDIVKYERKYLDQWEDFVASSNNGTIFHSRKFLSYHSPDKFKDNSLLFLEDKKIVALLTAAEIKKDDIATLWSHMGASFGGFVYKETLGIRQAFDLTETLIDYSLKNNFKKIVVTNVPIVYHKRYNEYFDFAFIRNGFNYLKREVTSVITLNVDEDNVMKLIKPESRTSVRRAEKLGVVVKKSNDFEEYYEILKSNLAMRHNVQPAHTLNELIKLKELYSQKIQLYGAYLEKKMIAGVVNFYCNDKVVLVFYISHNQEFQQYRAVNLLFYTIIKDAISRGLRFLDFGLFTVNMDPNWGLGKFKESFGARGILRDTFYLDLIQ